MKNIFKNTYKERIPEVTLAYEVSRRWLSKVNKLTYLQLILKLDSLYSKFQSKVPDTFYRFCYPIGTVSYIVGQGYHLYHISFVHNKTNTRYSKKSLLLHLHGTRTWDGTINVFTLPDTSFYFVWCHFFVRSCT